MKTYKQLRQSLDSIPVFNNPRDNQLSGWDDKESQRANQSTIYAGDLKSRMQNAYKRMKRKRKIEKLQSTDEWKGLE